MTTSPPAAEHALDGLAADLRAAILRTARRLRAQRAADVTDAQYSVLAVLAASGPMGAGDLAGHECVQPPTLTRTLAPLVDAGLVTRTPDLADRRQIRLALTAAGDAVVGRTRRQRDAWLAERLDALTEAERADLARAATLLRRLVEP